MTREEAIGFLQSRIDLIDKYYPQIEDYREALVMATKALQQEPCEDAISRQAVRDTIFAECSGVKLDIDFEKVILLQRAIKALPPVTPQPKIGYWIRADKGRLKCSECDIVHFIAQYPMGKIDWCPNCGTKMQKRIVESEEENDILY